MKWNKGQSSVSLSQADMQIMAQCRISVTELLQHKSPNNKLPPLWSVLSYAMLRSGPSANGLWAHYRRLQKMAAHTSDYYHRCQIPKARGGFRELFLPRYALQQEQSYILNTILCHLPVDSHACAYRKGISLEDCARAHVEKDVLIHLDLADFFGSVTENMVYETLLEETGYPKSLCRFFARICCRHGALPQGTVTSPMLSNIVFRKCDVALTDLAETYHMDYTRYSDDLFFSGGRSVRVKQFLNAVTQLLQGYGFTLNPEKTKVRGKQHRQEVLGLTVNHRLQVNREYRRELIQQLHYLERFGPNCTGARETGDYMKYMQILQGKLAYVLHIDPDNAKLWEAHLKLLLRMHRYAALHGNGFSP